MAFTPNRTYGMTIIDVLDGVEGTKHVCYYLEVTQVHPTINCDTQIIRISDQQMKELIGQDTDSTIDPLLHLMNAPEGKRVLATFTDMDDEEYPIAETISLSGNYRRELHKRHDTEGEGVE